MSRDVFHDRSGRIAKAAIALGFAPRKFKYLEANVTPFGAVIAAPPPETRELFCRSGLKYYARIPARNIRLALAELAKQRNRMRRARPADEAGRLLQSELDLAARMAEQSCHHMLWQQALAARRKAEARALARHGIRALQAIECDSKSYWPLRNKGTTARCSPFLRWRINDLRRGILHFQPEVARLARARKYAAE